ncbi:MAG: FAD-binding oxidoreductase [Chloroflexota bacterium]
MTQSQNSSKFEYIIVGKGLIGSAAARYLSQRSARVALIGPDEPDDWQAHDGLFASHYDEARIVSQSAPDEEWQTLDKASIDQYGTIEAQSGVSFFSPSGRLTACPNTDQIMYPYVASFAPHCTASQHYVPYSFPAGYEIVYEAAPSGYLNPRRMVSAQVKIAQQQNTAVFQQRVSKVQIQATHVEISLADGRRLTAQKVLLATGAFTNCFELLPRKLALKPETITTVLAEVSAETAVALKDLPPLNYKHHAEPLVHLSILPPLRYPNGRFYIKLFTFSDAERPLLALDEIQAWFKEERPFPYLGEVQTLLRQLLPTVDILAWDIKPCIVTHTPTWKPMIDCVIDGRLYVAAGGNGGAAHPSDALGKLAADLMVHTEWRSELSHKNFKAHYADEWAEWMSELTSVWAS